MRSLYEGLQEAVMTKALHNTATIQSREMCVPTLDAFIDKSTGYVVITTAMMDPVVAWNSQKKPDYGDIRSLVTLVVEFLLCGYIHGDIKPDNIVCSMSNPHPHIAHPRFIDFFSATALAAGVSHCYFGSAGLMSFEHAFEYMLSRRRGEVDPTMEISEKSELFSMAMSIVMIYFPDVLAPIPHIRKARFLDIVSASLGHYLNNISDGSYTIAEYKHLCDDVRAAPAERVTVESDRVFTLLERKNPCDQDHADLIDLLRGMLALRPENRLGVDQVRAHRFMQKANTRIPDENLHKAQVVEVSSRMFELLETYAVRCCEALRAMHISTANAEATIFVAYILLATGLQPSSHYLTGSAYYPLLCDHESYRYYPLLALYIASVITKTMIAGVIIPKDIAANGALIRYIGGLYEVAKAEDGTERTVEINFASADEFHALDPLHSPYLNINDFVAIVVDSLKSVTLPIFPRKMAPNAIEHSLGYIRRNPNWKQELNGKTIAEFIETTLSMKFPREEDMSTAHGLGIVRIFLTCKIDGVEHLVMGCRARDGILEIPGGKRKSDVSRRYIESEEQAAVRIFSETVGCGKIRNLRRTYYMNTCMIRGECDESFDLAGIMRGHRLSYCASGGEFSAILPLVLDGDHVSLTRTDPCADVNTLPMHYRRSAKEISPVVRTLVEETELIAVDRYPMLGNDDMTDTLLRQFLKWYTAGS